MKRFLGSVSFVTGASSGIGLALSLEIARQGGDIALVSRRLERLKEASTAIESMGGKALPVSCDVTRDGDMEKAVAKTMEAFGRIDYVVANAGFGVVGRLEKLRIEDYRRQFETNVFGVLRTIFATREHLISSKGCLALISSVNGYLATSHISAYAMSKFAINALAESLRHEFSPHGVSVVLIVPGYIESEIRQVNNMGVYRPEAPDGVPNWLKMKAEKAACQIADAIYRRRRIKVLTCHGKVAVFMQRHFPKTTSAAVRFMSEKGLLG